ncbi:hypothetical protein [Rhizobium sp. EC-SD404]|uniref:hypothetical protein n=1 Tax=Rhizobium sp. EC-SD404 TaxID=2038389 RepID=UPI00125349CB|nr:hypothetical protein [Rhizobium sp. EC-SD404]VVT04739.1 conserved hypothetical protein [Rhizobium sp. EC-SD404]
MLKTKPRSKLPEEGFEGAEVRTETVRISRSRTEQRTTRAMPGTFEWRYGRDSSDPLYMAGSHFARLWERASNLHGGSINYDSAGGGGWKGLPDGRAVAMQELQVLMKELGKLCSARLTNYCVLGHTSAELGSTFNMPERDVPAILNQDLRAVAMCLRYM